MLFCGFPDAGINEFNSDAETIIYDPQEMGITRKRKRDQSAKGLRKEAETKRLSGKPYVGYSRSKSGVVAQLSTRSAKSIGQRCGHKITAGKSYRSLLCAMVSERKRLEIFNEFWIMKTWAEKKAFVRGLVATSCKKTQKG